MKQEKILDALNLLDDEMIQEVDTLRKAEQKQEKGSRWVKTFTLAASICLLICGAAVIAEQRYHGDLRDMTVNEETTESVTEVTESAEADMVAFFIYQGNMYEQYDFVEGEALVGEYVGTATGMIDEWSKEEAYTEYAGSISGDFYEVDGMDPKFMLCMKQGDGYISTYINTTGLDLKTGADLYEDYIHLAGNYREVQYQTREDWYYSNGEPQKLSNEYAETIDHFVQGLNEGEIVTLASMPLEAGDNNIYDQEIYHLFFKMENGMTIHLRLFKNGYVAMLGMQEEGVLVEEQVFTEMTQVLEEVQ